MKYTIKDMRDLATQRGGSCLSDKYIPKAKLVWKCSYGHVWKARWDHVHRGCWCPYCAWKGKNRKYSIEDMRKLAAKKGGECLSASFINVGEKLQWKCADGHIWEAVPSTMIYRGGWCPSCRYLGERKCRYVFESLFNEKFPTTTVKPDDGTLILDGYAEALKMAFEYQGQQHYRYMPHLHKSRQNFEKSCERDACKVAWCSSSGIRLIVIPYWKNDNDGSLVEFIREEVSMNGEVDWGNFYTNLSILRELREFAEQKHGKLISEKYLGTMKKLEWECSEGHRWEAIPDSVKRRGSWCPYCAGNVRLNLSDIQQLAAKRRGKCLSTSYVNLHTKMEFECSDGHTWFAPSNNIKNGQWCPVCAWDQRRRTRRKTSIMRKLNKE